MIREWEKRGMPSSLYYMGFFCSVANKEKDRDNIHYSLTRMVKVELSSVGLRFLKGGEIAIERVLAHCDHFLLVRIHHYLPQLFHYAATHRRLCTVKTKHPHCTGHRFLTFPDAVPPATPIMNGDLAKVSGSKLDNFSGLGGGLKKRTSVCASCNEYKHFLERGTNFTVYREVLIFTIPYIYTYSNFTHNSQYI